MVVSNNGGEMRGYSLTIFNIDGIENVGIKSIRLKNRKGSIFIEDEKLIYNNYVATSRRVKLLGEMLLRVRDTVMTLDGPFRTRSLDFREKDNPSFTGTITLKKLHTPQETKLISTLEEMNLMNTVAFTQPEKPAPEKKSRTKTPPPVVAVEKKRVPDTIAAAAELAT